MNKAQFEAVVDEAIQRLPAWVHDALDNIDILVVDNPSEVIDGANDDLLGLYTGLPLTERDHNYAGQLPDLIYIFRQPHLALDLPAAQLKQEIIRTTWHEIAHYFGLDDEHLGEIGWG